MAAELRSAEWYGDTDRNAYIHRAWMRRGLPHDAFSGRPHIAIANTASDLTPCNSHLTEVARSVRDGVHEAGGIPLELPVASLGETQVRPTAMLWRNMAAMAAEEMFRANPVDGLVLLGGCDKFDSIEDLHARIDAPDLDVDAGSVLVLRGCGPRGCPGMPEVSNMPLPRKLPEQGVRDMVRVCDGRMSGTAYGTVVLHVVPEAAAGGPLALVRSGDCISLDVPGRSLTLDVPDAELAARTPNAATVAGYAAPRRGWERLYVDHVQGADTGADLDFLVGSSGSEVSRESH
ncbi:dihydroxy-acid dehydratase [Streptomyces sp. B22F1]|uniref:dihydroxy-acid dehydratase domain-containing protein n=1 Tax=Streptomyces sp. B22F1 TaxID=3153566 RepID=UPI00325F2D9E